jgi:C4-dicarboxylate-specific signal transduction histidine kinase
MGELAASIAHELNNPLAAVVTHGQACLRWLDRDTPDIAEVRSAVAQIVRDGIRGGEVIARVRRLMKKEPSVRQPLDVNEVVREAAAIASIQTDGLTLHIELGDVVPGIVGDRVAIQQVLLNLIGNAVDAMKPITDRRRELSICTDAHGPDAVSIAVSDSGVGVEPDRIARLFEPFHTSKPGGLGMGLSISRSIVESHGGRLWAEPNDAFGMTFRFTLPTVSDGGT